mgnify:FL=1
MGNHLSLAAVSDPEHSLMQLNICTNIKNMNLQLHGSVYGQKDPRLEI